MRSLLTDATVPFRVVKLLASQIAEATGGVLVGDDVAVDGASFDSRSIGTGQLFVPIVAARNGHDFIVSALNSGATAYLTAEEPVGGSAITVLDTSAALMDLARWARARLDVPVVGVTGSVGKTSTKDLIAAALTPTRRVSANVSSFNNEQGLPVTILASPDDTEVLVVEMGMRGFGEIARLCEVASPDIGVVTAVASSHTERVGGIDGVARAKRELVEALPRRGTAVLNADDSRVAAMAAHTAAAVVTYGRAGDVLISSLSLDDLARPSFHVDTPWGNGDVTLAVSGEHMASNAGAAIAVAGVLTGSIDGAVEALLDASVSGMRMEVRRSSRGAVIVNDAYNANPDSMRAALRALAGMRAERRVAVLGVMAELDDPEEGHRLVAADARELGIEVIAVGTDLYGLDPADDPIAAIGPVGNGDAVLVKASRVGGLERFVERLLDPG